MQEQHDKLEGEEITVNNGVIGKLSNFWYHYKWYVIVVAFFVLTFVFCFAQCSTKEAYDLNVLYISNGVLNSSEQVALGNDCASLLTEDLDGNGKLSVALIYFTYYSQSDLETMRGDANTTKGNVTESTLLSLSASSKTNRTSFRTYINTGDCVLLLVHPDLYRELADEGQLRPIAEVLGEGNVPDGALEYGIAWELTDFARQHTEDLSSIPSDTVVCLLKKRVFGATRDEVTYSQAEQLFSAMVGKVFQVTIR